MEVIPAINCFDSECVKERLAGARELGAEWVHFDVSDGVFASVRSWNNVQELKELTRNSNLKIETHLMIESPLKDFRKWLDAGVKRILVHVETVDREQLREMLEILPEEAELGLSLAPETPVQDAAIFLDEVNFVQLLAVKPGKSGQSFSEEIIQKIRDIRDFDKNVTIEVDGGVTREVAARVREAGADVVVSSSYIWESADPKGAFRDLVDV